MRAAFHLILATWLALGSVTVRAADDLHLYQAAAPVADHSEGARADALRRALAGVLVKVSGQAAVAQRASAQAILDRAATLVQRYGYQQRMPATTGQEQAPAPTPPEPKLWLTAVFDDVAVNRALLAAGLPVWGGKRPRTMVWVALG
ncbi:MAG: DUF2066 domain-containing protein, partial [Salinisphaera sp.]|nr:DUF2066 domain-containing protein [Salinisphaera sp.]